MTKCCIPIPKKYVELLKIPNYGTVEYKFYIENNEIIVEIPEIKYIILNKDNNKKKIFYDEIIKLSADDHYVVIKLENEEYYVFQTLSNYEKELENNGFIRVNKSVIINMTNVQKVFKTNASRMKITMKDDSTVFTSRKYYKNVKSAFEENARNEKFIIKIENGVF